MTIEERTARLTILIDPRKKALFERLCSEEDATPSQVIRRMIRRYIEEKTGQPWAPESLSAAEAGKPASQQRGKRAGRPPKQRGPRQSDRTE